MNEPAIEGNTKLEKALQWAMGADQTSCMTYAHMMHEKHPEKTDRQIAELVVKRYSFGSASEGLFTGMPSNPFLAAGSALADITMQIKRYSKLTATIGYLADKNYFSDPSWKNDAIVILAGPKVLSRVLQWASVDASKTLTRQWLKKQLSKEAVIASNRLLLKWLTQRISQKALLAKSVPIIGGVISGTWNFLETRLIGRRIIRYAFEEKLS